MRCTNDHERTDPDELLVHADVILFLGKHVAAQASRVEPCRNTLRPLPRDACQALRIQIRLAVSRVFAKLRDCKVSQHLGAVLKALLLEPRLKHAVLKEDQVCPAAWGDAEDHLVQNVVSRANNDGPCRSVGWERVSPLQNHVLATSHCGESLADSTCTNNNSGLNCTRSFKLQRKKQNRKTITTRVRRGGNRKKNKAKGKEKIFLLEDQFLPLFPPKPFGLDISFGLASSTAAGAAAAAAAAGAGSSFTTGSSFGGSSENLKSVEPSWSDSFPTQYLRAADALTQCALLVPEPLTTNLPPCPCPAPPPTPTPPTLLCIALCT
mmetsp:Transcript_5646/g.10290  ORF Transcript_5646/g.10290 Transcript_5646/m.10290 type:complete len:323 (+) Transcript_5646:1012-1980(+)